MTTDELFRLFDIICNGNKFTSENSHEILELCASLDLDKTDCVAEIISGQRDIKNHTPEQIITLLETALSQHRKVLVKNKNSNRLLNLDQEINIREARRHFVEDIFHKVLLVKLIQLYV